MPVKCGAPVVVAGADGRYAAAMRPAIALVAVLVAATAVRAGLPPDVDKALREATYVYVQSERKTGEWSKPAEIWLHYEQGAVYVATRPTSWRVRRIGWKRAKARIAVGKPDGHARLQERRLPGRPLQRWPRRLQRRHQRRLRGRPREERLQLRRLHQPVQPRLRAAEVLGRQATPRADGEWWSV